MARMRSVKPEFWHDQEITRFPRDTRLLYMALWNLADEHARLQGDPRYIKGQAFPYDDDLTSTVVDAMVDQLVAAGKVERYVVRGAVYLHLPKLPKHQRLDTDKVPSRLPGPDEGDPVATVSTPRSESRADSSGKNPDLGTDKNALSMWHVAGGSKHVAGSREQVSPTVSAALTRTDETLGAHANRLARHYTDLVPMSKFPAVAGIVRCAIKASHPDTEIIAALERLAKEGRTLTVEALRIELEGHPPRNHHNGLSTKAQGWLDMAAQEETR